MTHKGFSHIGLSTLDLDKTRAFYEGVLGFKPVVADTITIEEGGHLRHMFSMSAAVSSLPFWNRTEFPMYPQNTMRGSTAGSAFPPASIILLSRPARRLRWRRSLTNRAARVSRRQKLSTTDGRGRSISKTPTASRSSIAASSASFPMATR